MNRPELSLIILNYKTKGLLKQCLRGIEEAKLPMSHEVIVVDNNSQDGSIDMVRDEFPGVRAIDSPVNVGFAAGMNLGYRHSQGEFILILNPDVAIFRIAVETMLQYLHAHPEVGLVAPKLINPDGTVQDSCYRFYSFLTPLYRRTPFGKLPSARRQLHRFLMKDWDHAATRAVGWVLGGCMLIRREAIEKVGFFDERFFLYFEDVDLCRRMWQSGWQVHYIADAEMVHYHQRLSADSPGFQSLFSYPTRIHIQSWIRYVAKYTGVPKPPHSL
jgi:N-acetylglucosaminyl-diphospho-decaprenol L-rhamnosyltransferase